MPQTPQNEEGMRIEPQVSVAVANSTFPVATTTALPLEDPPATFFMFHGFFVGPKSEFSPLDPWPHASWFNLYLVLKPAFSKLATTVELYWGIYPSKTLDPAVVSIPLVINKSLCPAFPSLSAIVKMALYLSTLFLSFFLTEMLGAFTLSNTFFV